MSGAVPEPPNRFIHYKSQRKTKRNAHNPSRPYLRQSFSFFAAGKGADPKSPVGTAFSFSRPKRQANLIANVSRLLQFASKRFVNSFLTKYGRPPLFWIEKQLKKHDYMDPYMEFFIG